MGSGKVIVEKTDAHPKVIVWSLVIFVIVIVLSFIGMTAMYNQMDASTHNRTATVATPFAQQPEMPPTPRLQASPARDKEELQKHEESLLQGYGWVDQENGIVRIPIEQALAAVSKDGKLPDWTPEPSENDGAQGEAKAEEPVTP